LSKIAFNEFTRFITKERILYYAIINYICICVKNRTRGCKYYIDFCTKTYGDLPCLEKKYISDYQTFISHCYVMKNRRSWIKHDICKITNSSCLIYSQEHNIIQNYILKVSWLLFKLTYFPKWLRVSNLLFKYKYIIINCWSTYL